MRSLTVKLTLAFVLVGLMGAILVAVLVGQRTRSEFDRFLSERDEAALVQALTGYYSASGSWEGVGDIFSSTPAISPYRGEVVLVDRQGVIVLGNGPFRAGRRVSAQMMRDGTLIRVGGEVVGTVLSRPIDGRYAGGDDRPPPDVQFLERVQWAAAVSAGVAALLALLLGVLLARTLTRPVRELTTATQAMARGELGQTVVVRSNDEIGDLAQSFNRMSSDLARASQLRRQMTADLAHDLRTPLSILRGYTEGLQDGRLRGGESIYRIMHGEVEHLQRLVEDLRVLSLADAGELPLNRRTVDPLALLERTALAYMMEAEQSGVALRVDADETLPSIDVDVDRITQVLNNLVSNALRHTSEGEVALGAAAAGDQVRITVRDTGSGIAAEDLPFVFERFYRADKSRQRGDEPNSGLGLAISKAIVDAHGGAIEVASEPGRGTTFTITLPAAARREPALAMAE